MCKYLSDSLEIVHCERQRDTEHADHSAKATSEIIREFSPQALEIDEKKFHYMPGFQMDLFEYHCLRSRHGIRTVSAGPENTMPRIRTMRNTAHREPEFLL